MPLPSQSGGGWEGVHTCHAECPCQTGGEPVADFLPVEDIAQGTLRAELERAIETRENANAVSVRVEAENRRLRGLLRSAYPALEDAAEWDGLARAIKAAVFTGESQ